MASQASLESSLHASLRRSGRLALDVLERASKRSLTAWTSYPSETPTPETDEGHSGHSAHTTLDNALESIADFMTQTTHHCKRFYLDPTHKATENERAHVCRYHLHQRPLALQALEPENGPSWDQETSTLRCFQGHTEYHQTMDAHEQT